MLVKRKVFIFLYCYSCGRWWGEINLRKGRKAPVHRNATPRRRLSSRKGSGVSMNSTRNLIVFGLATVFGFSVLSANPALIILSVLLFAFSFPATPRRQAPESEFTF